MAEEFKYTWRIAKNEEVYTREFDKVFDKLLDLRPFVLEVIEKQTKRAFTFLITKNRKPIFFRRVFGKCGLTQMLNKSFDVVNVFGYEEDEKKYLVCEHKNNFYFTDDLEKSIILE